MRILYQSYVDKEHGGVYWQHLDTFLKQRCGPDTQIDIKGITPHDSYAHALVELRCSREMICNVVQAEREGYDAVIVGHFQDAGLYEAKSVVDIPVVGLGEASMLYSCQLAQRIGIVTINPRFIPWFHQQIRKYGLQDRICGVHSMTFEPGQILDALGSKEKTKQVKSLFCEQAESLISCGVELLLPGGGIPMLLFSGEVDFNVNGAPVVNGIEIALKMAEMAVFLSSNSGLGVSRVGDFIKPPEEVIEEFLNNPKGL